MDTSGTINRKQFTRLSLFIITLLLFLVPSVNEGNPLPVPMFISEFSVNPDSLERIELFVWDNGYGLENLDGFYVETNGGTFDLLDGLTIPDTGYVLLSESSFVGDFRLGDTSGYIDVRDQYHYSWDYVEYGGDQQSMVPAPLTGQSACAQIEWGEYGFYHDYFYLDGSPTFGAENDTAGAFGSLRGTVTDSSSGWPIQGALIEASRGVSAVTDSSGVYSMELLSGYQSVTASATGYRTDTSDLNEIAVLVDSTLIYDIDMSIASGLRRRGETTQSMPRAFSLSQNYPNPFNPSTSIGYQVSDRSHLAIRIFDLRGRLVRTLVEGVFEPGGYSVEWNGGDSSGRQVPSGIYIYRMEKDGDQVSAKKMVILK